MAGTSEWDDFRNECSERYLRHIARLRATADSMRDLAASEAERMDGVKAVRYDAPGKASPTYGDDAMVALVARMSEHMRFYRRMEEELTDEIADCTERTLRMEDQSHAELIRRYYCMGQTMAVAARSVGYSESWAKHGMRAARVEFYEHLPHTWRAPEQPAEA